MAQLPSRTTHFADWYQEVIYQAELVDQSPVRGCFVIRPYGYAIWENIQKELDQRIKATGHDNASFPLLIPESFLKKEAQHVEGFSPELAVVTHAGGKALEEPLVVRPTSETMIHSMFARWIKSWRDLPLKINQWANVVRWEMRPRAFLRTTEFFWQEGHTAHETLEQAEQEVLLMLEQYRQVVEDCLAIPVVVGQKSMGEKFPGADKTYTLEALMPDGRAVQSGTSHLISRSFAHAFNMTYQNREGVVDYPYLTSWGITTRLIGELVMVHGDERGLVVPPRIAPLQIVIIPIIKEGADNESIILSCRLLASELAQKNVRVFLDEDTTKSPGSKFYMWELKGVPVRIEMGPRDYTQSSVTLVNRVTHEKSSITRERLLETITTVLELQQQEMMRRAYTRMKEQWFSAEKLEDFAQKLESHGGFYEVGWCGNAACEQKLKEHKASIRCLLSSNAKKSCFNCAHESMHDILIAKSY